MKKADIRRRGQRGQATVEFALLVPVLLLIVVGLIDFGRGLAYWIKANHLANEGARWAIVDRNPSTVPNQKLQTYIAEQAASQEMRNGLSVCVDYPSGYGTSTAVGDPIRFRVIKQLPLHLTLGLANLTLTGSSTMRLENFATAGNPPSTNPSDNVIGAVPCS